VKSYTLSFVTYMIIGILSIIIVTAWPKPLIVMDQYYEYSGTVIPVQKITSNTIIYGENSAIEYTIVFNSVIFGEDDGIVTWSATITDGAKIKPLLYVSEYSYIATNNYSSITLLEKEFTFVSNRLALKPQPIKNQTHFLLLFILYTVFMWLFHILLERRISIEHYNGDLFGPRLRAVFALTSFIVIFIVYSILYYNPSLGTILIGISLLFLFVVMSFAIFILEKRIIPPYLLIKFSVILILSSIGFSTFTNSGGYYMVFTATMLLQFIISEFILLESNFPFRYYALTFQDLPDKLAPGVKYFVFSKKIFEILPDMGNTISVNGVSYNKEEFIHKIRMKRL